MRFFKRGRLVIIGVMGVCVITHAKQYSTEDIPMIQPVAELHLNTKAQRHCFYAGKEYSLGAILVTGNVVLECRPAQDLELNGPLKWMVHQGLPVSVIPSGNR